MGCKTRTLVGRVYRSKRWAKRWAQGRPIKKVSDGWMIMAGRKKIKSRKKRRARKPRRSDNSFFGF